MIAGLVQNIVTAPDGPKEKHVPQDSVQDRVPGEALDAFLEGVLADLKNPTDPETLNAVRAAFRKRIPFHLRSYAAALLILRAAGLSHASSAGGASSALKAASHAPRAATARPQGGDDRQAKARPPREARHERGPKERRPARAPESGSPENPAAREPRAERAEHADRGPVTPLFVSAGKRQRMKPGELRAMISEKTGIPSDTLGRVRLFDNYCFIDVPEKDAQNVVAAMQGAEFQGKPLEINVAKKRGESAAAEE